MRNVKATFSANNKFINNRTKVVVDFVILWLVQTRDNCKKKIFWLIAKVHWKV